MSETTIIKGRSPRNAKLLLAAAAQLEQDKRVVKTTMGGYRVPNDVAERYVELEAELTKAEGAPPEKSTEPVEPAAAATAAVDKADSEEPEKKTPPRKTAAKKTTPRKTAAKKGS